MAHHKEPPPPSGAMVPSNAEVEIQLQQQAVTVNISNSGAPIHVLKDGSAGFNMVCSLGSLRPEQRQHPDWLLSNGIQLRPGLRGRHLFKQGTGSHFQGRCFEWRVIVGVSDMTAKFSGGKVVAPPQWQLYEIQFNEWNMVNEKPKVYTGGSPTGVWNKLYTDEGQKPAYAGPRFCGLNDPAMMELLKIWDFTHDGEEDAPRRTKQFGKKTKVGEFKERQERALRAAAGEAFTEAMCSVCPSEPLAAFELLWSSPKWRSKWAPGTEEEDLLAMPFVLGLTQAYQSAPDKATKRAILSIFSPHFRIAVTCSLFRVSEYEAKQSRLQAADIGPGVLGKKRRRFRRFMKGGRMKSFAYLHQWLRSRYAVKAGDAASNKLERLDIRIRLLKKYREMSRKAGIEPMKRTSFYKAFCDAAGFADGEEKTCCCGSCVDGWLALNQLQEFAKSTDLGLDPITQRKLVADIQAARIFFDGPYRWKHLQKSSSVSSHCMQYALQSTTTSMPRGQRQEHEELLQCYNCTCDHEHTASCSECNQPYTIHKQFSDHVDNAIARRLAAVDLVEGEETKAVALQAAQSDGEVWREHVAMLHDEFCRWVGHIVRKHAASRAPPELKGQLKLWDVFLTIDYKCKPLSRKNRESQSENFGKRGKSLFGMSALFLKECLVEYSKENVDLALKGSDIEDLGEYVIIHVRVCCDDASQDWWHSIQVFTTAIQLLKKKCPFLQRGMLYSDGAGNFKGLAFDAMIPAVSAATGLLITDHILPEAGDGKDDCDRDFNGCNILFASYVKVDGNIMTNADEICTALEQGKGSGVINCALVVSKVSEGAPGVDVDTKKFAKLCGKSKGNLFHTKFEYEEDGTFAGYRFWVAFGFAVGKFLTAAEIQSCLAGTWPNMNTYVPYITCGTTLADCSSVIGVAELKFRLTKKAKKEKDETKQVAIQAKKDGAVAAAAIRQQARKAFRCPTCDYVSHFVSSRDNHAAVCFGFPSEEAQIMQKVSTFNFGAEFANARVAADANDDMQMQLIEAC